MNIIIASIAISGLVHIWADHYHKNIISIIFKPLTMVLVISILFQVGNSFQGYKLYVLLGLVFSLLGDLLLLKPWYKFEYGLGAFLIGHVFYITAFGQHNGLDADILPLLPFIGFVIWLYRNIEPNLGRVKIPVITYMVVILVMVWQGIGIWLENSTRIGIYTALGSFTFCVSDFILAYGHFKESFKYLNSFVLITYYVAQTLIAYSVNFVNVY